eukprot:CAMPEP_0175762370 /NCGR_PEP_ID=MMETSP0097-20121207/67163_1 /TAXON_ID=311494 /ORGANISM="Alexandrium monilatum, Strain CCMP3105" /LENGTH=274 /DNA_ID=CAMNT_0017072019 /DNA_START=12 /DNA_END=832 /DNA_ORIENTATION=+
MNPAYYEETPRSKGARELDGEIDLIKMFPAAFTMICLLLFVVPMWIVLSIGHLPAVAYFQNRFYYSVVVIPAITILVHIIHVRRGVPVKFAVVIGLVVPNLLLLWHGNAMYLNAVDKSEKLFSSDCNSFNTKRELQRSWEAAYALYSGCINETAKQTGHSRDILMDIFRIQDCEEYRTALTGKTDGGTRAYHESHVKDWTYLRKLEEEYFCAGWCYHAQQLWSSKVNKDSCSIVVANVYGKYVRPHASQVCVLMLAALGATAVMLIMVGPVLRR